MDLARNTPVWLIIYCYILERNEFCCSTKMSYESACEFVVFNNRNGGYYVHGIIRSTLAFAEQVREHPHVEPI